MVLLPHPRHARLDHGAVSPLRKNCTPICLRARARGHTPQLGLAEDSWFRSGARAPWNPQLSCPWQTLCPASAAECAVAQESWQNFGMRTWRHLAISTASPLVSPKNSCDHLGTPSRNRRASSGKSGPQQRRRHLENCANIRSIGL